GLFFGAQLESLNLAGRRPWQVGANVDPAWILPRSGAFPNMLLEIFEQPFVCRKAALKDDERFRLYQPVDIFLADDGGFEHRLVRGQCGLDVERRYPHAADLEHVVCTAAVVQVTLLVAKILVSRICPFADKSTSALGSLIPVTFARGRASHDKLADDACRLLVAVFIDDLDIVSRHRLAG